MMGSRVFTYNPADFATSEITGFMSFAVQTRIHIDSYGYLAHEDHGWRMRSNSPRVHIILQGRTATISAN